MHALLSFDPGTQYWQVKSMGLVVGVAYVVFCLMLGYSAIKHRGQGWKVGTLVALLMLTMPAWVGALFWIFFELQKS